ncbi:MAG: tRNA pseudouridine(38-40) synthase TruA [Candidatus Zixiibacteriota bacterium]
MRNIFLRLQFVGANYSGWQRQRNAVSVQQIIETALSKMTRAEVSLTGCSRTDAGVHAEDFIANFHTESRIPADKFAIASVAYLPKDILIKSSREVRPDFNSRRNAYEKTYRYQIALARSPFYNDLWWQCDESPDLDLLRRCCDLIVGTRDFSGFCVARSLKDDNLCTIKQATWRQTGKRLYFKITGDRFLHHMVRFLVGAQIHVACGKITLDDLDRMIRQPRKFRAKFPAPAEGLYLEKVRFRY